MVVDAWDGYEQEFILVGGYQTLFLIEDINNIYDTKLSFIERCTRFLKKIARLFSSLKHQGLMQATYIPFPMRICNHKELRQQSSSMLLKICVNGAHKTDDTKVFQSSVFAILTHKLKMFGWNALTVQSFCCFTLSINYGFYSVKHSRLIGIWSWVWPSLLSIHFIPVIIMEYLPYFLMSRYCLNSAGNDVDITKVQAFLLPVYLFVLAFVWFSYIEPYSDLVYVTNELVFMVLFFCSVNNQKYLPSGLFVRMLLQILGRMKSYIVLLIIYLSGFTIAFSTLCRPYAKNSPMSKCDFNGFHLK